jgi:hypothetical protein
MSQQHTAALFTGTIALLLLASCVDEVHPPFASDGDGGAAVVADPNVGAPHASPLPDSPAQASSPDTAGTVDQTSADATTPTTTTAASGTNTTFSTDATETTSSDGNPASTSEPSPSVGLTSVALDTSSNTQSVLDEASDPTAAAITGAVTDLGISLNGDSSGALDVDGGTVDGGAASGTQPQ